MNDSVELKAFKQLEEKRKRAILLNANVCPDCGEGHVKSFLIGGAFGHFTYYCIGEKRDGYDGRGDEQKKKSGCGFSISSRERSDEINEGKELNNVE